MNDEDEDDNGLPKSYDNPAYDKFVEDCLSVGLDPYHYRGRNYYEGPGVNVDYPDELPNTVPCQRDSMGMGFVFYPTGALSRTYECRGCQREFGDRRIAKKCCNAGVAVV